MSNFEDLTAILASIGNKVTTVKGDVEALLKAISDLKANPPQGMTPEQQASLDAAVQAATNVDATLAAVDAEANPAPVEPAPAPTPEVPATGGEGQPPAETPAGEPPTTEAPAVPAA